MDIDTEQIIADAKQYAINNSQLSQRESNAQWLQDALFCAYIAGIEKTLEIRIIY